MLLLVLLLLRVEGGRRRMKLVRPWNPLDLIRQSFLEVLVVGASLSGESSSGVHLGEFVVDGGSGEEDGLRSWGGVLRGRREGR